MPNRNPRIDRGQRDGLYELVRNHLGGLSDIWIAMEREDDAEKAARMAREFERDFKMLDDLGWEPSPPPSRDSFELRMPRDELLYLLERLASEGARLLDRGARRWEDVEGSEEQIESGHGAATELGRELRAEGGGAR